MSELSDKLEDAIRRAYFVSDELAKEYWQFCESVSRRLSAKSRILLRQNVNEIEIFPDAMSLTEFLAKGDPRVRQIHVGDACAKLRS